MAYIPGTPGDDGLAGTPGDDFIEGFGGGDFVVATSGNDTIDGGADWDVVAYWDSPGDLFVDLETGVAVAGWGGTQTLISIETIFASNFNNTLLGNAEANDFVLGVGGIDYVDGRGGFDTIFYESATAGVTIDLVNDYAIDDMGNTDTLISIEGVHASQFGDAIILDTVDGQGTHVFARAGDDHVTGSSEGDYLVLGSGHDTAMGGGGVDVVSYRTDEFDAAGPALQGVVVNLAAGQATDEWGFTDTLVSVEGVDGSALADSLSGSDEANFFSGNEGNDTLDGGAGNDQLLGGDGNDRFIDNGVTVEAAGPGKGKGHLKDKGNGHDKNEDKPGHAKHHGGTASPDDDYYEGGAGNDSYVFRVNNGHDHIVDFEAGDAIGDVIDVSQWNVTSFSALLSLASSANGGEDTVLSLNSNSSIYLAGVQVSELRANDFII